MTVDVFLKKYFALLMLLPVGVIAYLQASGVGYIASQSMAVDKNGHLAGRPIGKATKAKEVESHHSISASLIIAKNPMDSVAGDLNPIKDTPDSPDTTDTPKAASVDNPYEAPKCPGVELLTSTVSEDQAWSFATIRKVGGNTSDNVVVHQREEFEQKEVWFIRWDRIWLRGPGEFCQVTLFGEPEAAPKPVTKPPPKKPKSNRFSTAVPDDIAKRIQKVSDTEFNVDRGVIDTIMEKQAMLLKGVIVRPIQSGGKTTGLALRRISSTSLLGTLGVKDGDVLKGINGFNLASPEAALQAYGRLRTANHLTVSLERNGKPVNVDVNIK
jgi:general secretion pathway protein C